VALVLNTVKALWSYLREVSGENDYGRYRARVADEGGDPVTRQQFYDQRLQEKYSRPNRCC
jgi:uncharacterized short protein YbdD (DUF466 family)